MFRTLLAVALLCAPSTVHAETCVASHYGVGDGYGGRRTASGEIMKLRAGSADRSEHSGPQIPPAAHSFAAVASISAMAPLEHWAWAGRRGCLSNEPRLPAVSLLTPSSG